MVSEAEVPLEWGGRIASEKERSALQEIKSFRAQLPAQAVTTWLQNARDVEFLRFLRVTKSNSHDAWKMILNHAQWRVSSYGPDTTHPALDIDFEDSPLNAEAFWLGINKLGYPTLVIRTQVHDGIYYDEDPKIFTR